MSPDNPYSNAKNFTRGGQIILNNVRMWCQIARPLVIFFCLLVVVLSSVFVYLWVSPAERVAAFWYFKAFFLEKVSDLPQDFTWLTGQVYRIKPSALLKIPAVLEQKNLFIQHFTFSIFSALISSGFIVWGTSYFIRRHGEKHTLDQLIRGDQLVAVQEVANLIRSQRQDSHLVVGGLPLIKNAEIRNFFIHGTVGSGKTVLIRQILDYIRSRGDRAIVYDKGCDFVPVYYRPEKDILLNPLDQRCAGWNLWSECQSSSDYETLAAALIPMQGESDPFWVNAARTIFSAAARQMSTDPKRSTVSLLKYLLTSDLDTLGALLKGTEAESLVSQKIEKTAISIKSILATYLKSLRFLADLNTSNPFSIKSWIKDEKGARWLFVSSNAEQHNSLRPLISMWLDTAVGSLLSLPSDLNRRVWLVLDEAPSLHKLPYLPETFSEARKFGGCIVIGMQSIAQLKKVYGANAAEEISGLCNTRFFFRSPSHETAEWVSRDLGQTEIEDVRESYSYGANSMRDGISLSKQRHTRPVVSASEIMQQADLQAFVRLPGEFPITQIKLSFIEQKKTQPHFLPRRLNEESLKETDALIKKFEMAVPEKEVEIENEK